MIIDIKKKTFQPVKYLLISKSFQAGEPEQLKWTVLKRGAHKSGKPFRLLRKVRDFSDDDDEEEEEEGSGNEGESSGDEDRDYHVPGDDEEEEED